jgi:hypothetical protein
MVRADYHLAHHFFFGREVSAHRYGFASAEDMAAPKARLKTMNAAFKPDGLLDQGRLKAAFSLHGLYSPIPR